MSLIDTTTGSINNQSTQIGTQFQNQVGTNSNANVYTPQQQSLQQLAGNAIGNLLITGSPGPFGANPAQAEYANLLFNKNVAPRLAAQTGPGSASIAGAQQELNLGLAAMAQQQGTQNLLGAYDAASRYAFQPVGQTGVQSQIGTTNNITNTNQNQQSSQRSVDYGGLLDTLASSSLGALGGGFLNF